MNTEKRKTNMELTGICPKCGGKLTGDGQVYARVRSGDGLYVEGDLTCQECRKVFRWNQYYVPSKDGGFFTTIHEEEKEDDC